MEYPPCLQRRLSTATGIKVRPWPLQFSSPINSVVDAGAGAGERIRPGRAIDSDAFGKKLLIAVGFDLSRAYRIIELEALGGNLPNVVNNPTMPKSRTANPTNMQDGLTTFWYRTYLDASVIPNA